jgi:hypothetical protein
MGLGLEEYGYQKKPLYEGSIALTFPCVKFGGTLVSGNKYPFGSAIAWAGINKQIKVVNSPNDKIIGVIPRSDYSEDYYDDDGLAGFNSETIKQIIFNETVGIRVYTETDILHNDPVYVRHTANGINTRLGVFRNDDDGGNAFLFPNAMWYPSDETVETGYIAKAGQTVTLIYRII